MHVIWTTVMQIVIGKFMKIDICGLSTDISRISLTCNPQGFLSVFTCFDFCSQILIRDVKNQAHVPEVESKWTFSSGC